MRSEYELQTEKFLKDNKISFSQETIWNHKGCPWDTKHPFMHLLHKCKFRNRNTGKSMTVNFWGSIADYNDCKDKASAYDVLACINKYDVGTLDNFVSEFGYEVECWEDVKRIEKTYKAVCEEYKDVLRVFGNCIEQLREIS